MILKLLTEHHLEFLSWKGACTGSSESTLVKMPHCWKSHVTAHTTVIMSYVGLKLAFCPNTTLSVYREGFIAEFMGRTRTAVQAYTSAGTLPISDSARSPETYGYHIGKCIRRFGGIYAYCRYFIYRKW